MRTVDATMSAVQIAAGMPIRRSKRHQWIAMIVDSDVCRLGKSLYG